jgi:hypothetical protein
MTILIIRKEKQNEKMTRISFTFVQINKQTFCTEKDKLFESTVEKNKQR